MTQITRISLQYRIEPIAQNLVDYTMAEFLFKALSFAIFGAAMEVQRTLGSGYLEAVYQAALAYELKLRRIPF